MSEKGYQNLVPDTVPLLKNCKGGGADVIFVSLLIEAARIVDDGFDVPSIKAARELV